MKLTEKITEKIKKLQGHGRGILITFEGIEGSGKTTQLDLAAERLAAAGHTVFQTREPGGTRVGEGIRAVLLDKENRGMAPLAELFLYEACRAQLVEQHIRPELDKGRIVLCDRFTDATVAYQGYGRGLDLELIDRLNQAATGGIVPDLTLLLDCTVEEGFRRLEGRYRGVPVEEAREGREPDRMESEEDAFHEKIRRGYLALAEQHPERIRVIPAGGEIQEVHAAVMEQILKAMEERERNAP